MCNYSNYTRATRLLDEVIISRKDGQRVDSVKEFPQQSESDRCTPVAERNEVTTASNRGKQSIKHCCRQPNPYE